MTTRLVKAACLLLNILDALKVLKQPLRKKKYENGVEVPLGPQRISSIRREKMRAILGTWITWIGVTQVEYLSDRSLGLLLPCYGQFKLLVFLYICFTRSFGGDLIYRSLIKPHLQYYSHPIDLTTSLFILLFTWATQLTLLVTLVPAMSLWHRLFPQKPFAAISAPSAQPISNTDSTSALPSTPPEKLQNPRLAQVITRDLVSFGLSTPRSIKQAVRQAQEVYEAIEGKRKVVAERPRVGYTHAGRSGSGKESQGTKRSGAASGLGQQSNKSSLPHPKSPPHHSRTNGILPSQPPPPALRQRSRILESSYTAQQGRARPMSQQQTKAKVVPVVPMNTRPIGGETHRSLAGSVMYPNLEDLNANFNAVAGSSRTPTPSQRQPNGNGIDPSHLSPRTRKQPTALAPAPPTSAASSVVPPSPMLPGGFKFTYTAPSIASNSTTSHGEGSSNGDTPKARPGGKKMEILVEQNEIPEDFMDVDVDVDTSGGSSGKIAGKTSGNRSQAIRKSKSTSFAPLPPCRHQQQQSPKSFSPNTSTSTIGHGSPHTPGPVTHLNLKRKRTSLPNQTPTSSSPHQPQTQTQSNGVKPARLDASSKSIAAIQSLKDDLLGVGGGTEDLMDFTTFTPKSPWGAKTKARLEAEKQKEKEEAKAKAKTAKAKVKVDGKGKGRAKVKSEEEASASGGSDSDTDFDPGPTLKKQKLGLGLGPGLNLSHSQLGLMRAPRNVSNPVRMVPPPPASSTTIPRPTPTPALRGSKSVSSLAKIAAAGVGVGAGMESSRSKLTTATAVGGVGPVRATRGRISAAQQQEGILGRGGKKLAATVAVVDDQSGPSISRSRVVSATTTTNGNGTLKKRSSAIALLDSDQDQDKDQDKDSIITTNTSTSTTTKKRTKRVIKVNPLVGVEPKLEDLGDGRIGGEVPKRRITGGRR